MLKTRITEMLGIEHPIVQGGMMHVGLAELAAAVSNAGGLGIITGLTQPTPDDLRKEIKRCQDMTDKPFGVNLTILPTIKPVPYDEYARAICESGVKVVETAGRNPEPYMPLFREYGVKVIHKCTSVRHALKAESLGVAAVSVDGFECAGHPGEDDVPNLILLPAAAAKLKIPFLASGGIGTGAQMAACLALGADGINMGTRFMCTKEAPVHENLKKQIVAASELDTALIFRTLKNTARVYRNSVAKKVVEIELASGGKTNFDDIKDLVAGVKGKEVMMKGDLEYGIWTSGMVQGLINDIPSCRELVETLVRDCEATIQKRLAGMIAR
jgi:nitronate monooxygenase